MRLSIATRNANLAASALLVDGGYCVLYDGAPPTSPDSALSGNTLIVTCQLANPAGQPPSGGFMALNPTGAGVVAASGTPTFARFYRADGNTAEIDMLIPDEIVLSKPTWTLGEPFPALSISWSQGVSS